MVKPMNKVLAKSIAHMARKDQRMRREAHTTGYWRLEIDRQHTKRMKTIVRRYGWPTIQLVGKRASRDAWLLVQHTDHDMVFQERCLRLMERAFQDNPKSVDQANIAYLTDRVLVHRGKRQLFGTQFAFGKDGKLRPRPVENPKNLEKRRTAYGLRPMAEYLRAAKRHRLFARRSGSIAAPLHKR